MSAARDVFGLVGTTVDGKFAVERVIGEGGYGVVYAGRHLILDKAVALKCMKPLGTSTEDARRATELFLREAKVLFSTSHPGIVRLYDVGTITIGFHEVPYAVLELVEGRSLEQEIEERVATERPFTRSEIERLFIGVLEALAFTHQAGIAHRDLKPSNIMLVPSASGSFATRVLDFGVARFVARDTRHSSGVTGFTPAYSAPEQWSDGLGEPGPATDVFAVALTLAEACTLRTAMTAQTPAQIFGLVMRPGRKVDIGARDDLPRSLQLVLDRALAVRQDDRYRDAAEMLEDVRSAFERDAVSHDTQPASAPPTRPTGGLQPADPIPDPHGATPPASLRATRSLETAGPETATGAPARATRSPRVMAWALATAGLAMLAAGATGVALGRATREPAAAAAAKHAPTSPPAAPAIHVSASGLLSGDVYSTAQLEQVLRMNEPHLARCQRTVLAEGASAIADVAVFVAIHPRGNVWSATAVVEIDPLATEDGTWLDRCVAAVASGWRFPSHAKEDLTGAVVTVRFRPDPPGAGAPEPQPETKETRRPAVWKSSKAGKAYEYDTLVRTRGRLTTLEYTDGTALCAEYDGQLACRWVQIDSTGRASLRRKEGALEGTWGFGIDAESAGSLILSPPEK